MKMMLIAAALITFPAVVALIYGFFVAQNQWIVYAALASLGLNVIPFLAAGFMMRGNKDADMGGH